MSLWERNKGGYKRKLPCMKNDAGKLSLYVLSNVYECYSFIRCTVRLSNNSATSSGRL